MRFRNIKTGANFPRLFALIGMLIAANHTYE